MATKRRRATAGIEWVGGIVELPGYVSGEGEPYRAQALFWIVPGGPVLGMTLDRTAGALIDAAATHFASTLKKPMVPGVPPPARVRVASNELASALRSACPTLEIVCASTPELDEVIASIHERMAAEAPEPSYLGPGVEPAAVGALFRAAAALYRAAPWKIVPNDTSILSLTIEKLGVKDAVVSVIGQMGESHGVIVFSSLDDFDAFLDAARAIEEGGTPAMPPHFSLNFDRRAELSPGLRKEITQHRWQVAGPQAYPWLLAVDADLVARPQTERDVTLAEALSLSLAHVAAEKKALAAAFDGGAPLTRTLSVTTHAGEVEVTLRAPYEEPSRAGDPIPDDLIGAFAAMEAEGGEIDEPRLEELQDELVGRFVASPEGEGFSEARWCSAVMDLAASYVGVTIASIGAAELREILFEHLPRQVSVDAGAAGEIVAECRAFFTFLKRELSVRSADECLGELGDGAVKKLAAALSDPKNFGMAKSMMMAGAKAGFDMASKEGVEAWMRELEGKALPSSIRLPPLGPARRAGGATAQRAKKEKRKATRKARKSNR